MARIMIVEDEAIIAHDIKQRLLKMGYDVPVIVTIGDEACDKAGEVRPDVILMDIMLPGSKDGIDAAGDIQSSSGIPVIYLTAYTDDTIMRRARLTHPAGYLVKPVEDCELQHTIETAIHKKTE